MTSDRPRVLIIERSAEIGRLEMAVVKLSGCTSEVTSNGSDAIDALYRNPPDVILLGAPVEVEKGLMVLDVLAGPLQPLTRRTIVLTTFVNDPALMLHAATAGVYAVVAEPFEVEALCDLIGQCARDAGAAGPVTWVGVKQSILAQVSAVHAAI